METKVTKICNLAIHKDEFAKILNNPELEQLDNFISKLFFTKSGDFRIHISDNLPELLCNLLTENYIWFQLNSYRLTSSPYTHHLCQTIEL